MALPCLTVWGQNSGEDCAHPIFLDLPAVATCPSAANQTLTTSASTTNLPTDGTTITVYSAEGQTPVTVQRGVWLAFTGTSNRLEVSLTGTLSHSAWVLFRADSCANRMPVASYVANDDNMAAIQNNIKIIPQQPYLLFVGTTLEGHTGDFDLSLTAYNDCSTCGQRRGRLTATPAPINGTYEAGQTVQFCYDIDLWDPGFSIEWLHALAVNAGDGWNLDSLTYTAPTSCTDGQWDWYESWRGCNTGLDFGPGFAFDASMGLLCPGATPHDGLPGNNFGDGPCSLTLEAVPLPLTFCWTLQVRDDATPGSDLSVAVSLLGDGYSGSWMHSSCTDEVASQLLAQVAIPEAPAPTLPDLAVLNAACAQPCNGQLSIIAQSNPSWTYRIYDADTLLVYEAMAITGVDTVSSLCPGDYELEVARLDGSGAQRTGFTVAETALPDATIEYLPTCDEDDPFQLLAILTDSITDASYAWSGPDGFSATDSIIMADVYGLYQLQVNVGGCELTRSIAAEPLRPVIEHTVSADTITFTWTGLPTDTAYQVAVVEGPIGQPIDPNTYQMTDVMPNDTVSILLTILGTDDCGLSTQWATAVRVDCPLPAFLPDTTVPFCPGEPFELCLPEDNAYIWSGPPGFVKTGPCLTFPYTNAQVAGTYQLDIQQPDGCSFLTSVELVANGDCSAPLGHSSTTKGVTGTQQNYLFNDDTMHVYPNPANDLINISFTEATRGTLHLYHASGRGVWQGAFDGDRVQLDVSRYAPGVYWLQRDSRLGSWRQKLVVR